jgi:hypothetical protein
MRPPKCKCCEIEDGDHEVPIVTEFGGTLAGPFEAWVTWHLCEACLEENCKPWADVEKERECKLYPGEELGRFEGDLQSLRLV